MFSYDFLQCTIATYYIPLCELVKNGVKTFAASTKIERQNFLDTWGCGFNTDLSKMTKPIYQSYHSISN